MSTKRQKTSTPTADNVATEAVPSNADALALHARGKEHAQKLLDFINYSWTPFHAVEEASRRLVAAGFTPISEREPWSVQPGGRYFFTRNLSTIVAFAVGQQFKPGNGFFMVGAHTDSPCLKLKPVSLSNKSGYNMINVETYGGGLWYTWYDRDLGLAGRVLVREDGAAAAGAGTGAAAGAGGNGLKHRLVKLDRPLLRIPMLAIHLQRDIHTAGFKPNLQNNFAPMMATAVKTALLAPAAAPGAAPPAPGSTAAKHSPLLLSLLAAELGVAPEAIVDFELHVCDLQPGVLGGPHQEFVFSGRLDNLAMSYVALQSLIDSCPDAASLAGETGVRAIALFDHEEVGSESAQGAGGPVMRDTITRVARALAGGEEGAVERTLRNSFLVSADMAHALHPNYSDKHDPDHQPRMHGGLVLKHNNNQRYATNAVSAALFREVARRHGLPVQEFSVRNDMPCGSTIGPILASNLGCRTVDVGIAQLSMHSIREQCGADDVAIAYDHFLAFFKEFSALDASLDVDSLPPPNISGTIADTPCNHMH
ncbi:hypothetical protein CHLRE_10g435300v5 [Chlamydomonas reinhardtii]|uniref:Probable M18 family aminopeptidase 2 n=1 Tax=Chlamydomonas reinhardtii TaxID=3055 RepID=A0A2K3DA52_CHLRE|nr:uncharacterized protein CHLRE_10g435300v5 [Chlamydomonas reinhardtii]XP_042920108.1 uncharacterized protein CHLRE_10g435300v5 [Chlamydomonas reinhardtii]PNW77411.1 hypothetical protein CHLRE_10g435300v5 [Chlamydomonas reinhardtii]PNW77412.1 hypothetical protein CHLRE_10g435300v5 [Chlamydomonas reinhardtii]